LIKEKVLVVGLGEVGRPLFELLRESDQFYVYGFDIDKEKMRDVGQSDKRLPRKVDVMHVCVPCFSQDEFVNVVFDYFIRFKPKLVIINSTVQPGTTTNIHKHCGKCLVAHSPVRGVHKNPEYMKQELKRWTKYIGGVDEASAQAACDHFEKAGFKTKILRSSSETELAKLFETTYRAWMIACFQEMHRISRSFRADFDSVADFLEDTHRVRQDRPLMFPGVIGGHCLLPNIGLLLRICESDLLRLIIESNEKRKEEVKDKSVLSEVEKVKRRIEAFEEGLSERRADP